MFEGIFSGVFAFVSGNQGSNAFLLKGGREIALIDSSTSENRLVILSGLSLLGVSPESVSLILHTHAHADHLGLDFLFPNARIAMHESDAKLINSGNRAFACAQFFSGTILPHVSMPLRHLQKIRLGDISLKVLHTPGHTAGSVCFFLEGQKALFSGDTLFAEGFGRTDLPSGSPKEMPESLQGLQSLGIKALLPGHGPCVFGLKKAEECLSNAVKSALTNAFL